MSVRMAAHMRLKCIWNTWAGRTCRPVEFKRMLMSNACAVKGHVASKRIRSTTTCGKRGMWNGNEWLKRMGSSIPCGIHVEAHVELNCM